MAKIKTAAYTKLCRGDGHVSSDGTQKYFINQ